MRDFIGGIEELKFIGEAGPTPPADKTELLAAITAAGELTEGDYTPESWAVLAAAVSAGQIVYDDEGATQSEVDAATLAINEAIAALVPAGLTYAVWDNANKGANIVITGDGLIAGNVSGGSWNTVRATIGFEGGNRFYETLFTSGSGQGIQGIQTASGSLVSFVGGDAHGWGYYSANGQKMNSGGGTAYADPYGTGARIGTRFDDTNMEEYEWVVDVPATEETPEEGHWESLGQIPHDLTGPIFPACSPYDAGTTFNSNFGQDQTRTPPDGASWCGV